MLRVRRLTYSLLRTKSSAECSGGTRAFFMQSSQTGFSKPCVSFLFGIALQPHLSYSHSALISSKRPELCGFPPIHLSRDAVMSFVCQPLLHEQIIPVHPQRRWSTVTGVLILHLVTSSQTWESCIRPLCPCKEWGTSTLVLSVERTW